MVDVSIIILNYKSKGFTLNCIKSITEAEWGDLRYEVIVVDNNSGDSIGEILKWQNPGVKFVQNSANIGMGAGNNSGIKEAQGDFISIVNPDTIAFKDTFIKLHQYLLANPDVGVVGPQQLNPDKTIQDSCFRWPSLMIPAYRRTPLGKLPFAKKTLAKYLMHDFDHESEREVKWLLGSFIFIRMKAIKQVGMFDERYFLYFEDTDFCRSMWHNNWRVVYYPKAKIIHNHIRQSAQAPWWKFMFNPLARHHIISWLKYLRKWGLQ